MGLRLGGISACVCMNCMCVCVYVVKFRLEETHFWWSAFKSAYYLCSYLILDNKLNLHRGRKSSLCA